MKKILPLLLILFLTFVFFWQFILKGLLPIPADTVVGLYHPFRDLYAKNYPNGIPFKNFLITDPVRQQYPWRKLAISIEKKFKLPLWNPYSFSGTPLLGNLQSSVFYPLNILLILLPFPLGWSIYILLGPLLAGLFLFLYLNNLKLNKIASLLGTLVFSFSGFFISWLEWGTIAHTALWLPLILLSIDKLYSVFQQKSKIFWSLVLIFSLSFSFFSGYLQAFFYLFVISWIYFLVRWLQFGFNKKILVLFLILNSLFIILTSIQWIPALQFILLSARNIDQVAIDNPGWFIPWQHLIQFVAPDYFGNPATLNYWGTWNYGELVGYVGIPSFMFAIYAAFFRKDKKTFFFGTLFFFSLLFALPTFLANIPYILKIPLISSSQPTRLLFIADFSLAILSSLGLDYFLKTQKKLSISYPLVFVGLILLALWLFIPKEHLSVVKSNLILPTILFILTFLLISCLIIFRKRKKLAYPIVSFLIVVTVFDLFRFGWKFTPFTHKDYLFPNTKTIVFLQQNLGQFRYMTTDSRILPPNFSVIYKLQSVDGYDPLYLLRYGELIAASERKIPDIDPPFGFNRIITPHNFNSKVIDLLGVKYILSLNPINSSNLVKVFQEGQTIIYENKDVMSRAFFVNKTKKSGNKETSIRMLFDSSVDLSKTAIVENAELEKDTWSLGKAAILSYSENKIVLRTNNSKEGFLILTDIYYPSWRARIDGKQAKIYLTDYTLRGLVIPPGDHSIEFYSSLF